MKRIEVSDTPGLAGLVAEALEEPVLLVTAEGRELLLAEADDFAREVEELRASPAFQRFLDERSACERRVSLSALECEIAAELAPGEESA